jgi:ribosomal protein L21E
MASKKSGRSGSYVSKGERTNVNKKLRNSIRRNHSTTKKIERLINQYNQFSKGKNVVLTIPNPLKSETNKKFIRVNARDVWTTGKYSMKFHDPN